jgi:hypothetical protein
MNHEIPDGPAWPVLSEDAAAAWANVLLDLDAKRSAGETIALARVVDDPESLHTTYAAANYRKEAEHGEHRQAG